MQENNYLKIIQRSTTQTFYMIFWKNTNVFLTITRSLDAKMLNLIIVEFMYEDILSIILCFGR